MAVNTVDAVAEALTVFRETEQERLAESMLGEGFVGVVGEAQVGKTTLCRRVAASLNYRKLARVVYVDSSAPTRSPSWSLAGATRC